MGLDRPPGGPPRPHRPLAAYAGLALLCALLVGLWWTSYLRNNQLVQQSQALLSRYRADAAGL